MVLNSSHGFPKSVRVQAVIIAESERGNIERR